MKNYDELAGYIDNLTNERDKELARRLYLVDGRTMACVHNALRIAIQMVGEKGKSVPSDELKLALDLLQDSSVLTT